MRVRVLLPFLLKAGHIQEAGTEVDLPDSVARDLLQRRRVCALEQAPPAAGPMSISSSPALVAGKKGARKNAQ